MADGSDTRKDANARKPMNNTKKMYSADRVIGNGSFGIVYQATDNNSGETVAIKKVLQDRRYKNRELQIMKIVSHPNIVEVRDCFYSKGRSRDVYLNLVMEYIPETVYQTIRNHSKACLTIPYIYTKVYCYQICRAIAYCHSVGICHRDIKPQNLLLDPGSHVVKLCDFGSAKILKPAEANVSYICSRYYRSPELILESTNYNTQIDTWSLGCVFAECYLGSPLFQGGSAVDQLVEIIKVLGVPSKEEVVAMNPNYVEKFMFPNDLPPMDWDKVFSNITYNDEPVPQDATNLLQKFLQYNPEIRITPFLALADPFFDELRSPEVCMPNERPLPQLFNFTEDESKVMKDKNIYEKMVPPQLRI